MPATICRSSPPTSIVSTSSRSALGWSPADFTVATRSSSCWNSARVAIDPPFQLRHRLQRLRLEPGAQLPIIVLRKLSQLKVELRVLDRGQRLVLLPAPAFALRRLRCGGITGRRRREQWARRGPGDRRDQQQARDVDHQAHRGSLASSASRRRRSRSEMSTCETVGAWSARATTVQRRTVVRTTTTPMPSTTKGSTHAVRLNPSVVGDERIFSPYLSRKRSRISSRGTP